MTKAISPKDVAKAKVEFYPDYVLDTFNELIAMKFVNGKATIYKRDVIALMLEKANVGVDPDDIIPFPLSENGIYKKGYLDVEEVYREQGWKVKYTGPDYTESFAAYYDFKV